MTKNWDIFPKAQPVGEDLANFSCYRLYEKSAVAGYGVISGCVVSRNSSSRVDVSSGIYSISGVSRNYAGGYISGITAAASGLHRYDLVYIDGADDTLKILSGDEDTPDSSIDFLENYVPRPAEPTDTDWVILAVVRVTDAGIENSDFGTNSYATGSVANMRLSPPFVVDDITLQVVNGIISVKSSASVTKLDDLLSPDDNTDLNATSSAHGLLMKLSNSSAQFLNGQGSWAAPNHTNLVSIGTNSHSTIDAHLSSTSNPHNVTAAQAGAAPTAKGVTNGDTHDHSGGDGAQIDHGSMGGLGDDDHSGYARLSGRSGGQTFNGDTASGGSMILHSTSHGTKGKIYLGANSAYDQANDRLGVGVTSPSVGLSLPNSATAGEGLAYAWGTHSSRRWKENIIPIKDSINKVKLLQGVEFDWKPENGGKHDIGLIAEDVGRVIPEVVEYESNGIDAKSVRYDRIVALLIEVVKDQQFQIDYLKDIIEGDVYNDRT